MGISRMDKLVSIGRVIKAYGVRGEMKVEPLSDFSERYENLHSVKIEFPDGVIQSFNVDSARFREGVVVLKLQGIDDRESAAALHGAYVSIGIDEIVPLDENRFYLFQLEGLNVVTVDGSKIGTVLRVEQYPAHDVMVVKTDTKTIMIPAVKEFIVNIDLHKKQMVITMLEGFPEYPIGSD
jgi:16S rRNA processing protein RimM